ncbi:hypothetical protein QTJ16_004202 [Diplocarpon rosae]|uniref:Cell wall protein PhiA n=1 Tax=Diplocarpon rosae TaxID=946125 RepID=A0AAD9T0S4_9HELO|nr:hypothetical protein QTJ16_004202 [Diplocarpon rosae]
MHFSTATILASLATLGASAPNYAASPAPTPVPTSTPLGSKPFGLRAFRTGSAVQNGQISAAKTALFVNLPEQGASCDGYGTNGPNFATFVLIDEVLFLYAQSATPQTVYVDRSGMANGVVGYLTGAQPASSTAETKGWAIRDGYLYFKEFTLLACPNSVQGAWGIRLATGTVPAGLKDCVSIGASVEEIAQPVGCLYTQ